MPNGFSQKIAKSILSKAKSGDMDAFEEIYRTYCDASISLAYRICGNRDMAQDVVQEAFVKVINSIKNYRGDGNFAGWIRKIICNTAFSKLKESVKLSSFNEYHEQDELSINLFSDNWLDTCSDLNKFLEKLPKLMRAVLLMHEVEGYTHKEIAVFFRKSESFSKTTLSRAYLILKELAIKSKRESSVLTKNVNKKVEVIKCI